MKIISKNSFIVYKNDQGRIFKHIILTDMLKNEALNELPFDAEVIKIEPPQFLSEETEFDFE